MNFTCELQKQLSIKKYLKILGKFCFSLFFYNRLGHTSHIS